MSSAAAFQPHGLIANQMHEALYQRARSTNIVTGVPNAEDYNTMGLMQTIFYDNVFVDLDFGVASQQPPSPKSEHQCNIEVSYLDASWDLSALCFAECMRTDTDQPDGLGEVEQQALKDCVAHLEHYTEKPFIYAATMAGVYIRLWRYGRVDSRLQPLWGSNAVGDWAEYKDIGREQDARELDWHFGTMKGTLPTAPADQGNSHRDSSPTSATAAKRRPSDTSCEAPTTYSRQPTFSYTPVPALANSSAGGDQGQSSHSASQYTTGPSPAILQSSQLSLLADAIEVQVEYKMIQHKRKPDEHIYRFDYGGEMHEISYYGWREETVLEDGELYFVYAYTEKRRGVTFWTPTLDPESLTQY